MLTQNAVGLAPAVCASQPQNPAGTVMQGVVRLAKQHPQRQTHSCILTCAWALPQELPALAIVTQLDAHSPLERVSLLGRSGRPCRRRGPLRRSRQARRRLAPPSLPLLLPPSPSPPPGVASPPSALRIGVFGRPCGPVEPAKGRLAHRLPKASTFGPEGGPGPGQRVKVAKGGWVASPPSALRIGVFGRPCGLVEPAGVGAAPQNTKSKHLGTARGGGSPKSPKVVG